MTHPADLQAQWLRAWRLPGADAPEEALFGQLLARYSEPQRRYHTLQHLGECLAWFERAQSTAERPAEVALALWFHDAIYDVHAHDNESRSADWAREALRSAHAPDGVADRVHALVMSTRHDAVPQGADAALLVDIDLSILGAPPARFAEYERQIRAEYAHVPPAVFEPRRRDILRRFLDRQPLYATPGLRAACEAQARVNLRGALA